MCEYGNDKNIKVIHKDKVVKVDACIAPLVYLLNEYGVETIACCCGHGKANVSSIRVHPKNVKLSIMEDTMTTWLEFPYQGKVKEEK